VFHKVKERLDADLVLEPSGHDRTLARLGVDGPLLLAFGRRLPREALSRLHALIQTAASL
jgi:hypothetical protein